MTMMGLLQSVLVTCEGDASKANTCDIVAPLYGKVGSLAYVPTTFPIKAGDISGVPKVAVTLDAGLTKDIESTTTTLKVTSSDGDQVICLKIMTNGGAPEAEVTSVFPQSIQSGATTTITGTGPLKKDVMG